MTRHTLPLLGIALAVRCAAALEPPSPADVDKLLAGGFGAASEQTANVVLREHKPPRGRLDLDRSREALEEWLTLHRWCSILARTPAQHDAALLGRHILHEGDPSQPVLVPVGVTPPDHFLRLPEADLERFAASPAGRKALRERILAPAAAELPPPSDGFLHELITDRRLSALVLDALSAGDHVPTVLRLLEEIKTAHPSGFAEYPALAVAIAIVNDTTLPPDWPHHQVVDTLMPLEVGPVAEQFASWVDAHRASRLLLDPRKLSPAQLAFMVDAFVEPSELEWARKNVRLGRTTFDRAFDSIAYDDARLAAAEFIWNEGPYTLEAIAERGGICVDQAWFGALAGKARGLPTLFFTGQGPDGGHAWFGYMRSDDRWELDCGRDSRGNFAVGEALDPRTWLPITDHELLLLASNKRDSPAFRASRHEIFIASLQLKKNMPGPALETLRNAIGFCPENPDTWDAMADLLDSIDAPAAERIDHHRQAARHFASQPDLEAGHLHRLAAILRKEGDDAEADRIERSILLRNRRDRPDISVDAAAGAFRETLDSGDLKAAGEEFRRQLRTLGENAGGSFFYDIAAPYIRALLDAGDRTRARRELRSLRRELRPAPGSILDREFAALEEDAER